MRRRKELVPRLFSMQPLPMFFSLLAIFVTLLLVAACTKEIREENLFYPRRFPEVPKEDGRIGVDIPIDDDLSLRGGYFYDASRSTTLIYFYGNGETTHTSDKRADWLARELKVNVLVIDYRGYGASDGKPSILVLLQDSVRIYDHVQELSVGRQQIAVFGRSIGTAPAIHLASQRPLKALILEAPFTTISDVIAAWNQNVTGIAGWLVRLQPEKRLAAMRPQPIDLMADIDVPLLVLHGTQDTVIPMKLGKALYASCPHPDKVWCEAKDSGHNNLSLTHPDVERALRSFADRHMR